MATKKEIIRNLDAVINSRHSKAFVKGVECTAKWLATDHVGCNDLAAMMELQQNLYFDNARNLLSLRRLARQGQDLSLFRGILGWVIDYLIYLCEFMFGFINPILHMFFWSIFRIVIIIAFNIIFFCGIFLLLIN